MSAPGYDSYKESGVDWLGDVPSHWSIGKFRHRFRESSEKIDTEVVGPMLSVSGYRGVEIKEYDDENRRRLDEELVGYRIVRPGQLVANTMWLNYAGLGVSAHEGHVSPAYRSYWIRPGLEGRYTHHLMRSSIYVQGYTRLLTGIRPNSLQMSRDDLMEFPVVVPPLAEQAAIAAFLDRETGKIDALVEAQTRLIELLKEKRQAVISHAVTKGLDPAAPMKDSGVEWLGQVPAHWEVQTLKRVTESCCDGPFGSGLKSEHYVDEGVRVVRLQNIKERGFDGTDAAYIDYDYFKTTLTRHDVREGDMLIAGLGDERNLVGRACVAPLGIEPAMVKADCFRFRIQPETDTEFLVHQLNAGAAYASGKLATGSTRARIPLSSMMARIIALPPIAEQREIASELSVWSAKAAELLEQAEAAIILLQERRAALISAAVTGKIDARGLAPEQAEAA